MRITRLVSALAAISLVTVMLSGSLLYGHRVESRYIHALAPESATPAVEGVPALGQPALVIRNQGTALQAEAFRQADLLPL